MTTKELTKHKAITWKKWEKTGLAWMLSVMMVCVFCFSPVAVFSAVKGDKEIDEIVAGMSLDEKISQLIIPAIRTWKGADDEKAASVTDLNKVPELAEALKKHQYCGLILYGGNVVETEQVVRLISDLQKNNAQIQASRNIPYLMPVDEEGGAVLRLTTGTRMTGAMAVGATGANAQMNARATGDILGREMAAVGFNADFAPDADVNNNPANPVIGTRAFSDDPEVVPLMAMAFSAGLNKNGIIATIKHYPGHGDTGSDSHLDLPSVDRTFEQIKSMELVPFQTAVDCGADMIMTAHITFPLIDEMHVFPDGTKGFYPATMSRVMIDQILRNYMGYDGVVVTDALEMGAIEDGNMVPGEKGSVEYRANVAEEVIKSGSDILLLPLDMTNPKAVAFYDDYINALMDKVNNFDGTNGISEDRINESVKRVLKLKKKYGILDMDTSGADVEQKVEEAKKIVGCEEHHVVERRIASEAITLVKNDDNRALPLKGYGKNIVLLARNDTDDVTLLRSVDYMRDTGLIDPNVRIENLITGKSSGDPGAETKITIDYYFTSSGTLHYTDELKAAIAKADAVVCLSKNYGLAGLQDDNPQYQGVQKAMDDIHKAGGEFILLSDNLPYDSARFQDADAILLSYMGTGLGTDPTHSERESEAPKGAYNANVEAAMYAIFDAIQLEGKLPVNVPTAEKDEDGNVYFTDNILYERGFGIPYSYRFMNDAELEFTEGQKTGLVCETNARQEWFVRLLLDGKEIPADKYERDARHKTMTIAPEFMQTLATGEHDLSAVYDYGEGEFVIRTFVDVAPRDAFLVTMTAKGKSAMKFRWTKTQNADGYDIFMSRCDGKNKKAAGKLVGSVEGDKTFTWTKGALKKNKPYKAYAKAYVYQDGAKQYVKQSPVVYAYASGAAKKTYTNPKSVKVNKTRVTLNKGKSVKIKASVKPLKKGHKLIKYTSKIRYLSSNAQIAKVSKSGRITAVAKGKANIYAYAANGVCERISVIVK